MPTKLLLLCRFFYAKNKGKIMKYSSGMKKDFLIIGTASAILTIAQTDETQHFEIFDLLAQTNAADVEGSAFNDAAKVISVIKG